PRRMTCIERRQSSRARARQTASSASPPAWRTFSLKYPARRSLQATVDWQHTNRTRKTSSGYSSITTKCPALRLATSRVPAIGHQWRGVRDDDGLDIGFGRGPAGWRSCVDRAVGLDRSGARMGHTVADGLAEPDAPMAGSRSYF